MPRHHHVTTVKWIAVISWSWQGHGHSYKDIMTEQCQITGGTAVLGDYGRLLHRLIFQALIEVQVLVYINLIDLITCWGSSVWIRISKSLGMLSTLPFWPTRKFWTAENIRPSVKRATQELSPRRSSSCPGKNSSAGPAPPAAPRAQGRKGCAQAETKIAKLPSPVPNNTEPPPQWAKSFCTKGEVVSGFSKILRACTRAPGWLGVWV